MAATCLDPHDNVGYDLCVLHPPPLRRQSLLVLVLCCCSCTNQRRYEFLQDVGRAKAECENHIDSADRARCEAEFDMEYEEYLRSRATISEPP